MSLLLVSPKALFTVFSEKKDELSHLSIVLFLFLAYHKVYNFYLIS